MRRTVWFVMKALFPYKRGSYTKEKGFTSIRGARQYLKLYEQCGDTEHHIRHSRPNGRWCMGCGECDPTD